MTSRMIAIDFGFETSEMLGQLSRAREELGNGGQINSFADRAGPR